MQTVLPASELKSAGDGWPFVPVNPPPSEATTFESLLDRVSAGRAATDLYTQALAAVPLRTPVAGETDMTSPFGIRMHPILTYRNAYRDRSARRPWRAGASNGHRQGDRPGISIAAVCFLEQR